VAHEIGSMGKRTEQAFLFQLGQVRPARESMSRGCLPM
jgi:hypothetical protein